MSLPTTTNVQTNTNPSVCLFTNPPGEQNIQGRKRSEMPSSCKTLLNYTWKKIHIQHQTHQAKQPRQGVEGGTSARKAALTEEMCPMRLFAQNYPCPPPQGPATVGEASSNPLFEIPGSYLNQCTFFFFLLKGMQHYQLQWCRVCGEGGGDTQDTEQQVLIFPSLKRRLKLQISLPQASTCRGCCC